MAKIYIDQGHNPVNPNSGAEGNGYREQDLVYEIGVRTAEILRAAGQDVRLSRPTPQTQLGTSNASSLAARVNDANAWGADYFISIHSNYNTNPNINGCEAYVFQRDSKAWYLGEDILAGIVQEANMKDNFVRTNPSLYVLRATVMPAVLVELGYLSNAQDAAKLRNDPESFAYGIYVGMLNYFNFA